MARSAARSAAESVPFGVPTTCLRFISTPVRSADSLCGGFSPVADNDGNVVAGIEHVRMIRVQHSFVVKQQFAIQPQSVVRFPVSSVREAILLRVSSVSG